MAKKSSDTVWYKKLRSKYKLVIFNSMTFEERFSLGLSRLNVLIILLSLGIVFITLTFFIIAYTPLKEYIPGYPDINQKQELYSLNMKADSIMNNLRQKEAYIENIKNIIEGKDMPGEEEEDFTGDETVMVNTVSRFDSIKMTKSVSDSLLRAEFETQNMYNLYFTEGEPLKEQSNSSIRSFNFFLPIDGIITSHFDAKIRHYGTDIVSGRNEAVKATLEGTVIYADWTLETGNVIAIQHHRNLISIYKHNSVLLKREGDYVMAGDPIAIAGESGELTTGPHLHFELWYNGNAVDPEEYINFN